LRRVVAAGPNFTQKLIKQTLLITETENVSAKLRTILASKGPGKQFYLNKKVSFVPGYEGTTIAVLPLVTLLGVSKTTNLFQAHEHFCSIISSAGNIRSASLAASDLV